jgi:radical SAM superfamily enzyme YgiQ (UPF0313 family)
MTDILITAINARYAHTSLASRYLRAQLEELHDRSAILECQINQSPEEIANAILARQPRLLTMGIYIWNTAIAQQVLPLVRQQAPHLPIVLGGPEVSHETDRQPFEQWADVIIRGEGDAVITPLCRQLLSGTPPSNRYLDAPAANLDAISLPYEEYTDKDLAHRVLYVEASRGCPFGCDYCLSALDRKVRYVPLDKFLKAMERLLERGARRFKFVDRTFNLDTQRAVAIVDFFAKHCRDGLDLHFEMIPDRLPAALREAFARLPRGTLHLEVGLQTFDPAVATRINRSTQYDRVTENMRFLVEKLGARIHADLIAGLPGEDLEGFGRGFDKLLALQPAEIQVGILKRLRGAPITRHDEEWAMVYNPAPPYDLLHNRSLSNGDMQRLQRFARFWEVIGNRGNFPRTLALLWQTESTSFKAFMALSDYLYQRFDRTHTIPLEEIVRALFEYLVEHYKQEPQVVAKALLTDYEAEGQRPITPRFLREAANREK